MHTFGYFTNNAFMFCYYCIVHCNESYVRFIFTSELNAEILCCIACLALCYIIFVLLMYTFYKYLMAGMQQF